MGKYSDLWQKKQSEGETNALQNGFASLPKLGWYNPNKAVKSSDKGTAIVRVLPVEGRDTWYFEFKRHSFKAGTWRNGLCLESKDANNETVGSCPICEFLEEHKDELKGTDSEKSLKAKSAYALIVYDYAEKELKRLELNYYGFMDILASIIKNEDEEFEALIDTEGFNLHYATDENGWAKIAGVNRGKKTVAEIKEALGLSKIPDVIAYTMPISVASAEKYLNSLLDIAINSDICPDLRSSGSVTKSPKRMMLDDDEDVVVPKRKAKQQSKVEEDLSDDEEEIVVEESTNDDKPITPKNTSVISDSELDGLLDELGVN